jgi:lipoate-protein ligase A
MVACLNVPAVKLAKRDLDSAERRVVTMRELLGARVPELRVIEQALLDGFAEGIGIAPEWGDVTAHEEDLAATAFREEIGTDAYVEMLDAQATEDNMISASFTGHGGTVRADIRLEGARRDRIREVLITGDFFVTPPRLVFDLEAALRGLPAPEAGRAVESFFARRPADFLSLGPGDFRRAIEMALGQRGVTAVAS